MNGGDIIKLIKSWGLEEHSFKLVSMTNTNGGYTHRDYYTIVGISEVDDNNKTSSIEIKPNNKRMIMERSE